MNMNMDPFFRRMTMITGMFAFLCVILGTIAISTNYWTMEYLPSSPPPGMMTTTTMMMMTKTNGSDLFDSTWNGLFTMCTTHSNVACLTRFWTTTFLLCLFGLIFMFIGGICSMWEMFQTSDRRFVIPMFYFLGCVLMIGGLFDYASWSRLNSHSSRSMLCAIIFAYFALPMSAFLAGRYSTYDRYIHNPHLNNGQKYIPTSTNGGN